ncbi:DUF4365 domain-containing protein [Paenibacillus sp. 28ISP30-2]|nr:DUF4365 domain-containing protein [Paenibacillus sp. 28ISP30-2]
MKKDTSITDRAGVSLTQLKISNILKWIFREQPTSDYGIDAHIEIYDGSYPSGKLIALQIKTGESYTRGKDGRFIYYGDIKHYTYWLNHSLPVILVLCDLESNTIYWKHITKDTVELTKKGWKTEIKQSQILDLNSRETLMKISENKSAYERFLINMSISKPWMEALDNGGTIICESEEWINKSSGLGKLRIILNEGKDSEEEILWSNNIMLPFTPYEQAFEKLFPWADITIDHDFYEEFDNEDYELENGYYDKEEDKYVTDYSYYEDYLEIGRANV